MSKYAPLKRYLESRPGEEAPMTFEDVEHVLGFRLPDSARNYPAWWSNNTGTHVGVRAWRDAGWRTSRVDLASERVTFVREASSAGVAEAPAPFDAEVLRLSSLSRSAQAMLDDYSEEAGVDRTQAAAAMLEACAAERRRRMLETMPVARMPAGHDSTDLIREDRDAR